MKPSPVKSTIDFGQDGLQHGFLKLPHSHDESAYGSVMIPISMVKNGEGPTALLTGGNHGDEYEGPIALFDLAKTIELRKIRGKGDSGSGDELPCVPGRETDLPD